MVKVLRDNAQQRTGEATQALGHQEGDGMSNLLKQEFEKGVRAGMLLAADFPRAQLEVLEDTRKMLIAELELTDEEATENE